MNFEKWDIWLADVPFNDKLHVSKKRPVLVISPLEVLVLSVKMTSSENAGGYKLKRWQESGLAKQTYIITQC